MTGAVTSLIARRRNPALVDADILSSAERHHINQQALFGGVDAIVSIFLSLYLFRLGGAHVAAAFFCIKYAGIVAGFVSAGKLMQRHSTRALMRTGLFCLGTVYALLIAVGDSSSEMILWIALLAGVGEGLYWPGIKVVEYVVTEDETRTLYLGRLSLWRGVMAAVAPPAAAGLLSFLGIIGLARISYYGLFGALAVLLFCTWYHARSGQRCFGVQYEVRASARRPTGEWLAVLGQFFATGMWKTSLTMFAPMLIMSSLGGEFEVSLFAAVTTLVTAMFAVLAARLLHQRRSLYVIGVLAPRVGIISFAFTQSWFGLLAYAVCAVAFENFAAHASRRGAYRAMERSGLDWRENYHFVVELEIALNLGRIAGFGLVLLFLASHRDLEAVVMGLLCIAPMAIIGGLLQARLEKHHVGSLATA